LKERFCFANNNLERITTMYKTNLSKVIFGAAIIVTLGAFSASHISAACGPIQDKKTCQANKKCEWEEKVVPECTPEENAKAECWGWEKKKCLANIKNGCSWWVGCKDKEK